VFANLKASRLPQADIPFSAREADPENESSSPFTSLRGHGELIRLGRARYRSTSSRHTGGWDRFRERIEAVLSDAWMKLVNPHWKSRSALCECVNVHGSRGPQH
jgi:hypothetical protein